MGVCSICTVTSDSLRPHGLQPPRLLCPWNSPGKNTGVGCHFLLQVGCHFLLQGLLPSQGSNQYLLYLLLWQADSLPLGEWEALPSYVVVQMLSHARLFATPWTAAHQASRSLTISQSLPKFMLIALVMPSYIPSYNQILINFSHLGEDEDVPKGSTRPETLC